MIENGLDVKDLYVAQTEWVGSRQIVGLEMTSTILYYIKIILFQCSVIMTGSKKNREFME